MELKRNSNNCSWRHNYSRRAEDLEAQLCFRCYARPLLLCPCGHQFLRGGLCRTTAVVSLLAVHEKNITDIGCEDAGRHLIIVVIPDLRMYLLTVVVLLQP